MKNLFTLIVIIISLQTAEAGLKSPFQSTVDGLTIPNAHYVSLNDSVIRGMAPTVGHIDELVELGITDVLIFKNQTRNEVDKEIISLKKAGFKNNSIHQINFKWKEYESIQVACEQTIQAFQIIKRVREKGNKIFFHCTVGEDRTGLLSGLYKMMNEGLTREDVFQNEMCEKGYEAGNSHKPWVVVKAIRKDLTPLFKKMAKAINMGMISLEDLGRSNCQKIAKLTVDRTKLICNNSSLLNED
jgi:hypothetical protein